VSQGGLTGDDGMPGPFWRELTWRDLGWRVACLLGCAWLIAGVLTSLWTASCGGDPLACSTPLGEPRREAYAAALNFSVGIGPLALLPFTRNLVRLLVAGCISFGVTLAVIVLLWP